MASYSNSSLVSYTRLSPNTYGKKDRPIDRITPHCVVGQMDVEPLGALFAKASYQASSNYGIGRDGRIAMYVPESEGAWCSSNMTNDMRAVTIECASAKTHPYTMNAKVYASLVKLCVDICRRYNKTKLLWFADRNKTLAYSPKPDEMVLTVHRWFAQKACPGDWLYSRLGKLADEVTRQLNGETLPIPRTIKKGNTGRAVKAVQSILGDLTIDGKFGAKTDAAVRAYQSKHGLTVDGIVGPKTWTSMLTSI